jgi:hypothetical protein
MARWAAISERHKTERGYDMKVIAEDPDLDEQGREVARGTMNRMGRFTQDPL